MKVTECEKLTKTSSSLFNINFNQRYTIPGLKFDVSVPQIKKHGAGGFADPANGLFSPSQTALIEQKCYDATPFDNTQCEYCDDGPTSGGD